MSGNFVPEMHDIGKLINNDAIQAALDIPLVVELADLDVARDRLGMPNAPDEEVAQEILDHYTFDGYLLAFRSEGEKGFEKDIPIRLPGPETLTYRAIRAHLDAVGDDALLPGYPVPNDAGRLNLFLLILADHLASSVSRATVERGKGEAGWEVNVLWRGRGPHPKEVVTTVEGLRDILRFIAADPSAEEFLEKYGSLLQDIPEAKQAPRDATSLYTHVRLVGQFYRVLKANLESAPGEIPPRYSGESIESLADAEGKGSKAGRWPYRLLWYRIKFPQALVRARDLNVFILREHCLKSIQQRWPDNVLLHTSDSLTLFLPLDLPPAEVLRPLLVRGFFVDGMELVGDLGSLSTERLEEQWLRKRKQALDLEAQGEQIRKVRKLHYAEAAKKGVLQDKEQKKTFERDVVQPLLEAVWIPVQAASGPRPVCHWRALRAGPVGGQHRAGLCLHCEVRNMGKADKRAEKDKTVDELINQIVAAIQKRGVQRYRGVWFSNAQLDNLRQVLEREGYQTARVFQVGQANPRDNRFDRQRNETLLEVLDMIGRSRVNIKVGSYIIGKLNAIVDEAQPSTKGGKRR
jgi:hypothetical protein